MILILAVNQVIFDQRKDEVLAVAGPRLFAHFIAADRAAAESQLLVSSSIAQF